jgi:HEAT repeat protein
VLAVKRWWPLGLLLLAAGCGKSTADLTAQLKAGDAVARLHAVHDLEGRKRESDVVVPALAEVLKDEDPYVRRDAARALGEFGPAAKPAVPALQAALGDKEPGVRKAAGDALRKIDPGAVPTH